jgi:hypothetical protein
MLVWEMLVSNMDEKNLRTQRAKVPAGWLVLVTYQSTALLTFMPDPEHQWNPGDGE